jgi:hypothetical protein
MNIWAPPPFRIKFDEARDPYTARNALGITGSSGGGVTSATPPLSITGGVISIAAVPWTAYTPTLAAGSGSLTSASATGRFFRISNNVSFSIRIAITTNGTAATHITATLPVAAFAMSQVLSGYHETNTEVMSAVILSGAPTVVQIRNSAGEYPGANGAAFIISGTYEAA